ncbi:MAG: hypothetical protein IKS07_08920 [Lachnospiraceae bacterium]|nr:hypothetical protein [Lachnospiraceae bacterium]
MDQGKDRTIEQIEQRQAELSALFGLDRLISKSTKEVLQFIENRHEKFRESYFAYLEKGGVIEDETDRLVVEQLFCDLWLQSLAYLLDIGDITLSQRTRLLQDLTDVFCGRPDASRDYYRHTEQSPAYLKYLYGCFGIGEDSPYLFWSFVFSAGKAEGDLYAANRLLDEYSGLLMQIGYYLERWFAGYGFLDRSLELMREFSAGVCYAKEGTFEASDLVNPLSFRKG